jgi:hypothetical protein
MRTLWREAKKRQQAFAHIKIDLSGKHDRATCVLCEKTAPLETSGRSRQSLLLEVARKHYYKHKLDGSGEKQFTAFHLLKIIYVYVLRRTFYAGQHNAGNTYYFDKFFAKLSPYFSR